MTATLPHLAVDVAPLAVWLVLLAAIFVPLERLFALHPTPLRRRPKLLRDLALLFLNGLLPSVLLGLPLALLPAGSSALLPG